MSPLTPQSNVQAGQRLLHLEKRINAKVVTSWQGKGKDRRLGYGNVCDDNASIYSWMTYIGANVASCKGWFVSEKVCD